MRYFVGFVLFLLALGTLRTMGCGDDEEVHECRTDADCDDQLECTEDFCDSASGECSNPPVQDGVECSAGAFPGRCDAGGCKPVCVFVDCDDGNECTTDLCDRLDGSCDHVPRHDCRHCEAYPCNEICDDDNLCTWDSCECDPRHAYYGTCTFFDSCRSTQCAAATCDPAVGECIMTPINEGKGCTCYAAVCLCPLGTYRCVNGSCACTL